MKDSSIVERLMNKWFSKLGRNVATHPKRYIVCSILISVLLTCGVARASFKITFLELTDPYDGIFHNERDYIEATFPMNFSTDFDILRSTRLDRFGKLIAVTKDNSSLLTHKAMEEMKRLDNEIKNMSITWKGTEYRFEDICARQNGRCFENDLFIFATHAKDFEKGIYKFRYPIDYDTRSLKIYKYPIFMGGVEVEENGFAKSSKALSLFYVLDFGDPENDDRNNLWEDEFVRMTGLFKSDMFDIYRITSDTLMKEVNYSVITILPIIAVIFIIVVGFSIISNLKMDWVVSKPWLGIVALITAVLGIGAGFGISQMIGVPLFMVHLMIVFMMMGLALDDTFVILSAWRRTDIDDDVIYRLEETYRISSMPITITSLTNLFSFMVGITTPFPLVRLFCINCALCVFTCYCFTITFFGAVLSLYGGLEKKRIHALTMAHHVTPKSLAKNESLLFRLMCTGGKDKEHPYDPLDNQDYLVMRIFRDYYAKLLLSKFGTVATVIIYLFYLGIAFWGSTKFNIDLKEQNLVNVDSYAYEYFVAQYAYFSDYQYRMQITLNEPFDYSSPKTQRKIAEVLSKFQESILIDDKYFAESWLDQYTTFLENNKFFIWYGGYDCHSSTGFLTCLKEFFLKLPGYNVYNHDIAFNENRTEIIATRYYIQSKSIPSPNFAYKLAHTVLDIRENSEIHIATLYNFMFIYAEHLLTLTKIGLISIGIAIAIMIVIAYVFIPNFKFVCFMVFTILSVEIGLVGYMSLCGWYLNSLTLIILIISVGFSVDTTAHVMCAYEESNKGNVKDKLIETLFHIGQPIMQGCLSSIIGLLPLMFMKSEFFKASAFMMTLVILFALIHGIAFIPILFYLSDSISVNSITDLTLYEKSAIKPSKPETKNEVDAKNNGETKNLV